MANVTETPWVCPWLSLTDTPWNTHLPSLWLWNDLKHIWFCQHRKFALKCMTCFVFSALNPRGPSHRALEDVMTQAKARDPSIWADKQQANCFSYIMAKELFFFFFPNKGCIVTIKVTSSQSEFCVFAHVRLIISCKWQVWEPTCSDSPSYT